MDQSQKEKDFAEALDKIREIMDEHNLGFMVQHNVIIVPKPEKKDEQD